MTIVATTHDRTLLDMARPHPSLRGLRRVLYHPGFPVDIRHNAKIGRETLAEWAAERIG